MIRAEAEDLGQQSQISLVLRARSIVRVTMPHPSRDGRSADLRLVSSLLFQGSPAATLLGLAALFDPEALIEIEVVAARVS